MLHWNEAVARSKGPNESFQWTPCEAPELVALDPDLPFLDDALHELFPLRHFPFELLGRLSRDEVPFLKVARMRNVMCSVNYFICGDEDVL